MKSVKELLEIEELFANDEDKQKILAMPELQRETKLFERYKKLRIHEMDNKVKEMDKPKLTIEKNQLSLSRPKYPECDFILPRSLLSNNIFKPFIGICKGCFIRAMINKAHVICKIIGFTKIQRYELNDSHKSMCTVGLKLDTGKKIIDGLQISSVSASKASENEFEDFLDTFEIQNLDEIRAKSEKIKKELARGLEDSELTAMIENRLRDNPKKKTNTQKKIEIISKRDEAIQRKNKEEALRFQAQLEKIEDEEREDRKRRMIRESEERKKKCL